MMRTIFKVGVVLAGTLLLIAAARLFMAGEAPDLTVGRSVSVSAKSIFQPDSMPDQGDDKARQIEEDAGAVVRGLFSGSSSTEYNGQDLFNTKLSHKQRRQLAWTMAKGGRPEDFSLLTKYLSAPDAEISIKAAIVEALGYSSFPAAREWMVLSLDCGSESIACAAVRGLAAMNDSQNAALFSQLLSADELPISLRNEVAVALGKMSDVQGGRVLMDLWQNAAQNDPVLQAILIEGLAQRNSEETAAFFSRLMKESQDPALRQSVVEAVSRSTGNVQPFLMDSLSDTSPDVRAAAAWGVALQQQGEAFGDLMNYLQKESDLSVRKQLYEALAVQSDIEPGAVLNAALKETDDEVRLIAYSAVSPHLQKIPTDYRAAAEDEIVSDLKRLAVSGGTLNIRLRAVIVLRQADTEKTKQVLSEVITESKDTRVIKATGVNLNRLLK